MTALAATDVSVSIPPTDRNIVSDSPKLISLATITFGDGALTYPTGGVPMPDKAQFGFCRQIQHIIIQQPVSIGFVFRYDQADHKMKILTQGVVTGSTSVTTSANGALVENSASAEGVVRLYGTAVDTTYDLGALIELPAAIAIAEVSLALILIGE